LQQSGLNQVALPLFLLLLCQEIDPAKPVLVGVGAG
jgi:hypothetical protein